MDMNKFEKFTVEVGRRGVLRGLFGLLAGVGAAVPLIKDADAAKKPLTAKQKARKAKQRRQALKRRQARQRAIRVPQASVTPTIPSQGNPTCADVGESTGFKVEPPQDGSRTVELANCACTVAYDVSADKKYLSFTSTCPIKKVLVKGGNSAYLYTYPGTGSLGDTNLRSPNNAGGNIPDISHFNFCGISCPTCKSDCKDKECGPDGCGGYCGTCGEYETCNNGTCDYVCKPDCQGKECGPDGCGGKCGECGEYEDCKNGTCEYVCKPNCDGKECGSDGCGGTCGTCGEYETCNDYGICKHTCKPKCDGKACGDDGCGGTCGTCPYGETCDAYGTCVGNGTSNPKPPDTGQNYTKICKATCQRKCVKAKKTKQLRGARLANVCRRACAQNCRK